MPHKICVFAKRKTINDYLTTSIKTHQLKIRHLLDEINNLLITYQFINNVTLLTVENVEQCSFFI